ncbi:hypothetical protein AMS68_002095 [Peltaster fructicola]|uniref:Major facilitator superfamily (MFS) profile domain-containing protein n=1 Tax=Peltaster fructicola TaxID=286661 RepID=A0A6H0XPL8_9PEZI|nr:hypothetical protein AMS68_002095 [Peltaster fructicola]
MQMFSTVVENTDNLSSVQRVMAEREPLLRQRKNVVQFEEDDKDNPRNWPRWRKLMAWIPIVPVDLAVSFGASGYSPVTEKFADAFEISTQTAVLGLSLYTLALAFGPMINAPMSEYYGRLPVYMILYGLSLPFFVGSAMAPNFTVFLVTRFFCGLLQSVTIANLGGTIADLYDIQHTGKPMSVFIWAATCGSSLGYFLMSFVAQDRPWQDVFWVLLAVCGGVWFVMCCFIGYAGETRSSVLLRRIAAARQKETGETMEVPEEYKAKGMKQLVVSIQARPFRFLTTESIIVSAAAYNGSLYGISFLLNGAFALVFAQGHGYNTMETGLCFAGIILGVSLGPFTNLLQEKLYVRDSKGGNVPEARLQLSKVAAVAFPVSLFWFAWTSYSWMPAIVPILASALWGWSFFTLILMTYMYTEDSYGEYSSSALAGLGFVRNAAGAGFPLFGRQMFDGLGYQWAATILAFLAVVLAPIPFVLADFGKRLRKRSPYASEQFEELQD